MEVGVELHERLESKRTFGQAGVRHRQAGLVDLLLPVEEEVEVDRPRPPAGLLSPFPAKGLLDRKQPLEQRARRQVRLDRARTVEEARLVDVADRLSLLERRDGDDLDPGL